MSASRVVAATGRPPSGAARPTTGSRYLAEALHGYGTTHLFFVPTVLLSAMAEMEDLDIRRVVTHGEKAAAYMADGFARASGRPGICLAQHVGGANLAAGLRDARLAGAPVIAITGGPELESRYRHAYQQLEDFSMFDPVTKLNAQVDDVRQLPHLLRQAFRTATTGTPGPVHLRVGGRHGEVLEDVAELALAVEPQFAHVPPFRPEADLPSIDQAIERLRTAQRPIIVAGGGVVTSGAAAEVVELAERLAIPVATSLNGKASIPDGHPLAVGVVGTYSRRCANQAVAEADLCFFIGSRTGQQVTNSWKLPRPGAEVIQLDIEGVEIGRNYCGALGLVGDARASLLRLLDRLGERELAAADSTSTGARAGWVSRVQSLVEAWRTDVAPLVGSDAAPLRPERICIEIGRALPDDGVVVADTGHSGIWAGGFVELRQPGQRFIRCAGSLGWAFPAALGVKCALPHRAVVCFTGDGGFMYHQAELETAARYGINAVIVVNNNHALNQEKKLFDKAYGGTQRGRAREMWTFYPSNFAQVAEAMGCLGLRVERPNELGPALQRALSAERPAVVEVLSDIDATAPPAWGEGV